MFHLPPLLSDSSTEVSVDAREVYRSVCISTHVDDSKGTPAENFD